MLQSHLHQSSILSVIFMLSHQIFYTFPFSSLRCAINIIYRNIILGTSVHCFYAVPVALLHLVSFPITCIHFTYVKALTFSVVFYVYCSFILAVLKFCFSREFLAKRQFSFNPPQLKSLSILPQHLHFTISTRTIK